MTTVAEMGAAVTVAALCAALGLARASYYRHIKPRVAVPRGGNLIGALAQLDRASRCVERGDQARRATPLHEHLQTKLPEQASHRLRIRVLGGGPPAGAHEDGERQCRLVSGRSRRQGDEEGDGGGGKIEHLRSLTQEATLAVALWPR